MTAGIPFLPIPQLSDAKRAALWRLLDRENGDLACWPWAGPIDRQGYGYITLARKRLMVHRVIFSLLKGPIPPGMQVDHNCHNLDTACPGGESCAHRRCGNPQHLRAVSAQLNTLSGRSLQAQNAAKSACLRGHQLSGSNLYVPPSADGRRYCRACRLLATRKRYGKDC